MRSKQFLVMCVFIGICQALFSDAPEPQFAVRNIQSGIELTIVLPQNVYAYRSSPYATVLTIELSQNIRNNYNNPQIPEGEAYGEEMILKGRQVILIPLKSGLRHPTDVTGELKIIYQLCDGVEGTCFMPSEKILKIRNGGLITSSETDQHDNRTSTQKIPLSERLGNLLKQNTGNPVFSFILALLGGILASLTPCIYPVIPVTIGYFSKRAADGKSDSRIHRIVAAFVYTSGMTLIYTALGVIAGLTGSLFGSFTNTPVFFVIIGIIFYLLSLSLFEVFEFRMPSFLSNLKGKTGTGSQGFGSVFIMGVITGLVASPCVGPIVFFLLTGVIQQGNPVQGGILMFGFASGMSILFLLIALFSHLSSKLPRSGYWMVRVKIVIGSFVFASGLYFLNLFLKTLGMNWFINSLVFLTLSIVAIILTFFKLRFLYGKKGIKQAILAGVLIIIFAGYFIKSDYKSQFENPWSDSYQSVIELSRETDKPVFLDIYADWCGICKKLDKEIKNDPELMNLIENNLIPVQMNYDNHKEYLENQFGVTSLPFVVIVDPKGMVIWKKVGFDDTDGLISELKDFIKSLD